MKIAITAIGTRGDLQPFLALGLGLRAAGHDVTIISAKNERSFVEQYGLRFHTVDVDIQQIMAGREGQQMANGRNPLRFILGHLSKSAQLKQRMIVAQSEIWAGCQNADILIFHPGMPLSFFIAQTSHKISVLATPFPVIPTRQYPSILFYKGPRLGQAYNRLTHWIFDRIFWALAKPAIQTFWRKKFSTKPDFSTSAIQQQLRSGMPVLNGYSPHLFAQPIDWPTSVQTTGSWFLEAPADFVPPDDLVRFINEGPPPIYVGFGSMKDAHSFRTTLSLIQQAMTTSGLRAVVGLGWNTLDAGESLPDNLFLIGNIPHSWLFPQMTLVVHHGGAGTTAAGLTAGKPTIIIPHNADQPAWGQRVYELGVGPEPIPKIRLTADNLSSAIQYALKPSVVQEATRLGQQLRQEKGVERAVAILNQYVKS